MGDNILAAQTQSLTGPQHKLTMQHNKRQLPERRCYGIAAVAVEHSIRAAGRHPEEDTLRDPRARQPA